jgi:acylphosphatase
MKRHHLYIKGYVQGVGFRWYVQRDAEETKVYGWVKNLNDGRVEVIAEGEESDLVSFLQKIQSGYLGRNISEINKSDEPYTGKFTSFDIVF